jgi:hypothetical protein
MLITSCNKTPSGVDSATCSGFTTFTGGVLGDGVHISATKTGSGAISNTGGGPTVSANLTVSGGGTPDAGAGIAGDSAKLDYYVTVLPLGALATSGLRIPLIFTDAGSLTGSANANGIIGGDAQTFVRPFTGEIVVDGGPSSFDDDVSDTVDAGPLSLGYARTHHLVFDFGEGDVVAKVTLTASCSYGTLAVGFATGTCAASADPFVSFDQAAFDAQMGAHTFNLSNAFRIATSSGLDARAAVPEPASWSLMIAG